ncbi:N-acetylmuramoyl-L-alanine amidase [Pseudonocardia sp. GCM10023141]|uniref:N-acetylmuramoyl-L-alanine amidase n=1 Tax=Pseudonocardia sp. GCM10023141 TaxID=3252653 RepID=UPI00361CAA2C
MHTSSRILIGPVVVGAALLAAGLSAALGTGASAGGSGAPVLTTASAPPQPPAATAPRTVLLDPGHAGRTDATGTLVPDGRGGEKACNTTGTETNAGYAEHAFTFDVAQRVAARLRADGVVVVLTRADDSGTGPCVDERGRAGEAAGADAVVSIHGDGAPADGHGFHVAFSDPPLNPAQEGPAHALAVAVRDAMRGGGFVDSTYLGHDGLSPRNDLAGLNLATRPSVLVECANMRNAADAAVMSTPEGRESYAAAITTGIQAFLARA